MTFVIAALVILLTFALGALIAFLFTRLDRAVDTNKETIELQDKGYNPGMTMGYAIDTLATADEQVEEARKQAAKQAAALPRGANMRIGWSAEPGGKSASVGVPHDPWTAAKIAEFHGWEAARTGIPAGGAAVAPVAAAVAAPAAAGPVELVPGKDYPVIEITDDMPADEVRKARIANAKAKSAALKAAKAAGTMAPAAGAAAVAAAPAAAAAVPLNIEPPVLIPISDDMPPDELRKARIANSKAKSAFNKALKAAGIDPATVELDDAGNVIMPQTAAVAAAPAAPASAVPAAAAGPVDLASLGIAPPDLTPLSDDMSPDDLRKARITNSKAKSAFNKALKEAGIDPKDVEVSDDGQVTFKAGAVAAPAAAPAAVATDVPAASASSGDSASAVDFAALGIAAPELVDITDDMSPDEIRQARIANSKAKSAFNKALKAAGIDPKTVEL